MKTFVTCCILTLSLRLQVTIAQDSVNYVPVGCYEDELETPRPLPELIHNYRSKINWTDYYGSVIEPCAREVRKKNYLYFGIQFYGECWSGPQAHKTYSRDGKSDNCEGGVGKGHANMVYRLTGDENECLVYKVFNTRERSVLYQGSEEACDDGYVNANGETFVPGWYRFEGEAGTLLNDDPMTSSGRCLTNEAAWYQGPYPNVTQGIVDKKACFMETCYLSVNFRVRNCGLFFVYDFNIIPGCYFRYCGNGIVDEEGGKEKDE